MRLRLPLFAASAALAAVVVPRVANAQSTGFAIDHFEPAERGSTWFAQESLDFRGTVRPAFGVVGDYSYRPLAIYDENGDVRATVVGHAITTHVGGSLVLGERLRLAVSVPFVLFTDGQTGRLDGVTYRPPASEQALGDVRAGADLRLFGEHDDPITMAIGVQAWAPTGDTTTYTSDGRARIGPHALVAGQLGSFAYAAKVGFTVREPDASTFAGAVVGNQLDYGLAGGLRVEDTRFTIGPEIFGSTVVARQAFKTRTTPIEGILGTHYVFDGGFRLGAGIGTGLTRGYGAPQLRGLLSIEWMPDVVDDQDGDGVLKDDACPEVVGVRSADPAKNGCPKKLVGDRDLDGVPNLDDACPDTPGKHTKDARTDGCADKDGDGILDPLDACVDEPGVSSDDPKTNGCPELDTDKDGVVNREDACPKEPGAKTSDPKTNGCPPDKDRDKDGIDNDLDACPDEPGAPDVDPKRNGCPKAFVSQGQIKIIDQVKFKSSSAQIQPGKESEEVLQAVRKVIADHPEIKHLRVEGYTDDRGPAAFNKKLSRDRAAAVVKWLVKNGVEGQRLTSEGFGPERPIDKNSTEEGRKNNRRVEFHIERDPLEKP